jgi:hypothetical protein
LFSLFSVVFRVIFPDVVCVEELRISTIICVATIMSTIITNLELYNTIRYILTRNYRILCLHFILFFWLLELVKKRSQANFPKKEDQVNVLFLEHI